MAVRHGVSPTPQPTATIRVQVRQDEVAVVATDPARVAGPGSGRLDPLEDALLGEGREGVVHRLDGDGTDLSPDALGHGVGCHRGFIRARSQNGNRWAVTEDRSDEGGRRDRCGCG